MVGRSDSAVGDKQIRGLTQLQQGNAQTNEARNEDEISGSYGGRVGLEGGEEDSFDSVRRWEIKAGEIRTWKCGNGGGRSEKNGGSVKHEETREPRIVIWLAARRTPWSSCDSIRSW